MCYISKLWFIVGIIMDSVNKISTMLFLLFVLGVAKYTMIVMEQCSQCPVHGISVYIQVPTIIPEMRKLKPSLVVS